jgi:SAM-dependent methyltransferase
MRFRSSLERISPLAVAMVQNSCARAGMRLRRALGLPLPGARAYLERLRGKAGIEIGGPTKLFRRDLPLYRVVRSLDGVNFSHDTVWEGQIEEGRTYSYMPGRVGRQFIMEATQLSRLAESSYDFLLSSNNLEHIANPILAINEWIRVVRPGGCILLVLPKKESNFDRLREVTSFRHLLDDFERGMTERDLTHLPEILERHDYSMTPDTPDRASLELRGRANFENRCLHHHVFDMPLIEELLAHVGLRLELQMTTRRDYVALASKP